MASAASAFAYRVNGTKKNSVIVFGALRRVAKMLKKSINSANINLIHVNAVLAVNYFQNRCFAVC